jgi:tetratricopeptide (TPR) repeat protein
MNSLAVVYMAWDRPAEAVPLLHEALEVGRQVWGPENRPTLNVMGNLGRAYHLLGQYDKAEPLLVQALKVKQRVLGVDKEDTLVTLRNLGQNYLKQMRFAEAEPILREHLTHLQKQPDDWRTAHAKSLLGSALLGQKKFADAEPLLVEGYEGLKRLAAKIPPDRKVNLTEARERLVQFYEAIGKPDEAAKWREPPAPPTAKPTGKEPSPSTG